MMETVSAAANMDNAFAKGMRELAARDRRKAARVREEICQVLGEGQAHSIFQTTTR